MKVHVKILLNRFGSELGDAYWQKPDTSRHFLIWSKIIKYLAYVSNLFTAIDNRKSIVSMILPIDNTIDKK